MVPLIVLFVSLLLVRGLGALGVNTLSSWPAATRYGLAVMFLFTASAHFTRMKEELIRMVPESLPYPRQLVSLTGICEVLGAIGLLMPSVQRLAGMGLILLLVAMFPANVNAARRQLTLRGRPATPLWLRLPMQLLFIGLLWWSTQLAT
jgi:uncharacterized membrane protein